MIGPAIKNLRPESKFSVGDTYDTLLWLDDSIDAPTEQEVAAEVTRLRDLWTSTQYQRDREPAYPSLADLADALYWQSQGDDSKLTEYYAKIAAVKEQYPKE
jgi:hypothetical protein